jgi:DNA-binding transcriptional regulator YiaG
MSSNDVKRLRRALGLSREKFAIKFGVSASLVYKWESGERAVAGPALILLDRAFRRQFGAKGARKK